MSFLGIVLFAVLVLGKTFYIQRVQGNYWRSMSDSLHQKIESIDAERGTIFSEDGQMLSTSIPTFDIYIDFLADGLREKKGIRFDTSINAFSSALSKYFGHEVGRHPHRKLVQAHRRRGKVAFGERRVRHGVDELITGRRIRFGEPAADRDGVLRLLAIELERLDDGGTTFVVAAAQQFDFGQRQPCVQTDDENQHNRHPEGMAPAPKPCQQHFETVQFGQHHVQ